MDAKHAAAGMVVVLSLAACAAPEDGGSVDSAGASSSSGATATPSATPVATPVATGTAAESEDLPEGFLDASQPSTAAPAAHARLTVTQVRVGAHEDYDRVVFELAGAGTPGWEVGYVDGAYQDGSGSSVEVAGDGVLQVMITGTGYPADTGFDEWPGRQIATEGYAQLWDVRFVGTFEGRTQAVLGLKDDDAAYRVFTLGDPVRVVVDVRH